MYVPPPGLGARCKHYGLEAGKSLDEAVGDLVRGDDAAFRAQPGWARALAVKVVRALRKAGLRNLRSQVVVCNEKVS